MQRPYATVFFCLVFCVLAFPQDRGTVQCDPGMDRVPAFTAPGRAYVVEQLSCDQMISIVGLERGYVKIQIGEKTAYVDAKYVRLSESREQQITEPIEQAKELQQPAPSVAAAEKAPPSYITDQGEPRRHEGGLNFEISNIKYHEPSLDMQESGMMWGVSGEYIYRPDKFMLKVDGRFSLGNVDYRSPSGEFDDIRDYNIETRFTFGYVLGTSDKASFTPFMGLGHRYLFDELSSSGEGGYNRKSNYLYSPIGMETMFRLGGGWSIGVSGEYDLFWHGWQYSEFGDYEIDPDFLVLQDWVAKNDQKGGWGARGSIRLIKNLGRIDFSVEPYFRYWDIEDSDIFVLYFPYYEVYWLKGKEPANTSQEWGAKIGIRF